MLGYGMVDLRRRFGIFEVEVIVCCIRGFKFFI